MKKKSLFTVIIIMVAVITAAISICVASAEEASAVIKYGNIKYGDGEITLDYAVSFAGVPNDAERGLLIWKRPSTIYVKGREDIKLTSDQTQRINGKSYQIYSLEGISEKEVSDEIYAVAYAKFGTRIVYSGVNKFSPLRYSYMAEGKIGSSSGSQRVREFLSEMIENGALAQRENGYGLDRPADTEYAEITLTNGVFDDNTVCTLAPVGSLLHVTAYEDTCTVPYEWTDTLGNVISEGSAEYIRVPSSNTSATAKYKAVSSNITYVLGAEDASFDQTPPESYELGKEFIFPTPTREGYLFAGWYTSPDYETESCLNYLGQSYKGDVTVYAAWSRQLFADDYTILGDVDLRVDGTLRYYTEAGSVLTVANKDGSTCLSDEKGVVWHVGSKGSQIDIKTNGGLAALMGDDNKITFVVPVSAVAGKNANKSLGRLRVINANGASETISMFMIGTDNSVYLGGNSSYKLFDLTEDFQNIIVCVDFENGILSGYDENGVRLQQCVLNLPSTTLSSSLEEWKSQATSYVINWYSGGTNNDNEVRIGGVYCYSGNLALRRLEKDTSSEELVSDIEELKAQNDAFEKTDFESIYSGYKANDSTSMPDPVYLDAPYLYDRDGGTGARLMLNRSMVEAILATMQDEEYSVSYSALMELADAECDGILPEPSLNYNGRKGLHNFSAPTLAVIEAKAFMYRLMFEQGFAEGTNEAYQRDKYGYEALVAMKNFLLTLDIQYINSDQCREFGYVMFVAAEVYDWCYPLLSDEDKEELIYAVVARCCTGTSGVTDNNFTTYNGVKIEIGFPPSAQGSVSGHGSEAQILRDYLAFALAIYDEDPSWWNYVAGRVVGDYVVVRNVYHEAGIPQQGVSNYAQHRHYSDLYSAWIIQTATGINPYTKMEGTVLSMIGSMNPSGKQLYSNGDGSVSNNLSTVAKHSIIAAALYQSDEIFTWAYELNNSFKISSASGTTTVTIPNLFIFLAQGMERVEDKYEALDLIQYNGGALAQIISRSEWNNTDAASTFMKIGVRTTANHEHRDSGTFQIYYKGLLTSDAGLYSTYGHEQTHYYHQATVGHNGLLIFNPSKYDAKSSDPVKKWYSGGQRKPGEAKNLSVWLGESYDYGELLGVQYGYKNAEKTKAAYAYISGDVAKAYDADTVDRVSRSMLTVYTDDPDFPMYFFVFDGITSDDASFKKTFLLHIKSSDEPTISGNTVTTVNGEGKLVVHSLTEGATIEGVGGRVYDENGKYDVYNSKNYLINGEQIIPANLGDDKKWGRVEISVSGSKESTFMHAMYVTDADSTAEAPAVTKIEADGIEGAIIDNVAAVFRNDNERTYSAVSFTANSSGTLTYYVAGLHEGSWNVEVNGKACGTAMAGEGGLAIFTAPAGEVLLTPGEDVMPEGGGRINYVTNGGVLPEDAPGVFKKGGGITLPIPENDLSIFEGWYTTASFEEGTRVEKIPADASVEYTVYAKWTYVFFSENYEDKEMYIEGKDSYETFGESKYIINSGEDGSFEIATDEETGLPCLVAAPAKGKVQLTVDGYDGIEHVSASKIAITVSMSTTRSSKSPRSEFALKSRTSTVTLFTVNGSGSIYFGGKKIAALTTSLTEYVFTVDFAENKLCAYDGEGNLLHQTAVVAGEISSLGTTLFEWTFSEGGFVSLSQMKVGKIDVRTIE